MLKQPGLKFSGLDLSVLKFKWTNDDNIRAKLKKLSFKYLSPKISSTGILIFDNFITQNHLLKIDNGLFLMKFKRISKSLEFQFISRPFKTFPE